MISTKLTKIGDKMGEFEELFAIIPNSSTGQDIRKKLIEILYPQCHKNQSKKPDPLEFSRRRECDLIAYLTKIKPLRTTHTHRLYLQRMISTKLTKIGDKMGEFEEFFATIPNPSTRQDIRKKLIEILYPQCHKNQSKKPDPLEWTEYKQTIHQQ